MKKVRRFVGLAAAYTLAAPAITFLIVCYVFQEAGEAFEQSKLSDRWSDACVALENWANG